MSGKFVLSLIFALVVAIFAIQNAGEVDVKFLFWNISISQAIIVLVSAIAGAVATAMISLVGQMKLKSTIRNDKSEITALKSRIEGLESKIDRGKKSEEIKAGESEEV